MNKDFDRLHFGSSGGYISWVVNPIAASCPPNSEGFVTINCLLFGLRVVVRCVVSPVRGLASVGICANGLSVNQSYELLGLGVELVIYIWPSFGGCIRDIRDGFSFRR